jgi:hypothetical protein
MLKATEKWIQDLLGKWKSRVPTLQTPIVAAGSAPPAPVGPEPSLANAQVAGQSAGKDVNARRSRRIYGSNAAKQAAWPTNQSCEAGADRLFAARMNQRVRGNMAVNETKSRIFSGKGVL